MEELKRRMRKKIIFLMVTMRERGGKICLN